LRLKNLAYYIITLSFICIVDCIVYKISYLLLTFFY